MSLDRYSSIAGKKYQRGFLMPLAIFIIVSMAGFAIVMARTTAQTNSSSIQAMIAIQAFYAADSGAQWGMNQLFYNTGAPLTRTGVDASCSALSGQSRSFNVDGLRNCSATLQCVVNTDVGNTTSYYLLTSSSTCGDQPIVSQRVVELSAFMK